MNTHWHVASGLAGYGPDGADGFATAESMPDVADLIRYELGTWAEFARDQAHIEAELSEFEQAWNALMLSERIDNIRADLDTARADAPLYAGKPNLWADAIRSIVDATFPLDVSGSSRVYAWECAETDCDSYAEYLAG